MRRISREAGITQAAIYHHFENKEALYYAAVRYLHEEKTAGLTEILQQEPDAERRLGLLVSIMLQQLAADSAYQRIYFRELLEGDEERLRELATNVFADLSEAVEELMQELAPHMDAHLLTLSLAGLMFHHLEARRLSPLMRSGKPEHTELPVLAEHITSLLLNGVHKP